MFSIIIIIIFFILYYIIRGRLICPCTSKKNNLYCYRFEIWGLQINHLIFYTIIGFIYPNFFFIWQLLGIIWELLEFIPTYYPKDILPYIGGCIDKDKINKYYIHPIDKTLPRSKIHFWHPKFTDILLNIIGFYIGYILFKIYSSIFY